MTTRCLQNISSFCVFTLLSSLLIGCSRAEPKRIILPASPGSIAEVTHAFQKPPEVIKVNKEWNYAVVEDENMPEEGRKGEVLRNDQVVGRVEASAQRRPPFLTASIVEGSIQRGDKVRWLLPPRRQ